MKEEEVPVKTEEKAIKGVVKDPKRTRSSVKAEEKSIKGVVKDPEGVRLPVKTEEKASKGVVKDPKRARKNVTWDERYNQCMQFYKKHNHCKIPTNFKEDKSLGIWVQEQRRDYKKLMMGEKPRRALTSESIEKLSEIGFHWGCPPDPNKYPETDDSWGKNFALLKQYEHSHDNFDVPLDHENRLGKWTRVQRTQKYYRDGKRKCLISKDRIKKLDEIGFDWDGQRKLDK